MASDRLEGISIDELTEKEVAEMQTFAEVRMGNYPSIVVPAKTKHQVVYRGNSCPGIAISTNGRTDFRQYDFPVKYTKLCDTFVFQVRA